MIVRLTSMNGRYWLVTLSCMQYYLFFLVIILFKYECLLCVIEIELEI